MAGAYPDIPGNRFAYDQDGSRLYTFPADKSAATDASANITAICDFDDDNWQLLSQGGYGAGGLRGYVALVFPEARDVVGYFLAMVGGNSTPYELEWSTDTTDGIDGTWTRETDTVARSNTSTTPYYRTGINTVNWPLAKGVRFGYGNVSNSSSAQVQIRAFHLYGNISSGQNPDRLRFWDDVNDAEIGAAHFDFGDIAQGTMKTVAFRVKNNSATLTAGAVSVTRDSPSFPELVTGLQFSTDGGSTWNNTASIGDLAPGAISSAVQVRRSVAVNETATIPKAGRLFATATSWA